VRLLAGVLALVVLALVLAGAVAATTLRGYLVKREDDQLRQAAGQILHGPGGRGPRDRGPEPDDDNYQHLPSAFVTETLAADGTVLYGPSSRLINDEQSLPDFPRFTIAEARQRGQHPFTVRSQKGDDGDWRALALPLSDGSGTLLVATSLGDVESTVGRLVLLELAIGAGAVLLIAVAGGFVVHAALRPLRQVEDTAAAIAAGDLTQRVPERDERTEVGRLGAAINTMLEQIEALFRAQAESEAEARRSEEKMRRFVADASHELRTPLTSIRGFAELYRMRDRGESPAEVTHAMQRIEQEATRMGLLVDDLLLLARLDEERPLRRRPVDLLELATTTVHDARITAPDRSIEVVVGRTDPLPVVTGDAARLHQVVANLVNNALEHTAAPVEVRVSTDAEEAAVLLDVVDHGPGLAAEDAAHVFERFYRADRSRSREDGGAGLGLAIVAALVARHDGTVRVQDTPGGGATFRVRLPLAEGGVGTGVEPERRDETADEPA
jgi:two-component system OmpR family sensor kinase